MVDNGGNGKGSEKPEGAQSAQDAELAESRVRWWIVGRFSPTPSGTRRAITPDEAASPFKNAPLAITVSVVDRLGASKETAYTVAFGKVSDLTIAEVIRSNPTLAALREWADKRIASVEPKLAAAALEAISGPGRLVDAARDIGAGDPATARKPLRALVERAVFETARDVLVAPGVAELESAWRGLRLVADRCGKEIELSVIDVNAADAATRVDEELGALASFDRPDAIFITEPVASVEEISRWGGIGADYNVPVVVEGTPRLIGGEDLMALSTLSHESRPDASWNDLRAEEGSLFVCVALNRLVGKVDGAGVATRTSLVGPAFGLAALLSQSFLATGGPGRIFGSVGGLVAGGTHEITGRGEPLAIALEAFFSIDIQTRLAAQGVLGLGGPRNSDRVQLSVAPMLSSAKEAGGLPAQLLTARSIRFAQWARDQIPTGTPDLDVIAIFEQGAAALLFPNKDVAQMNATVTELEGARMVVLRTRARGEWLGVPMDASFALPLR